MAKRAEGRFSGFQGASLFYQSWKVDQPHATLVVTHGMGEHSDSYNLFANAMNAFGWDVYAFDLRGHGKSSGVRGVVDRFTDYGHDLIEFMEVVRSQIKKEPIVLVAHSMGGLIVLRTILEFGNLGSIGLALSSPLLGVALEVPAIKEWGAKILVRVAPSLTLHNEIEDRVLTHDAEVLKHYMQDPLRHTRVSLRLYDEILKSISYVQLGATQFQLPMHFQLAGNDLVVSTSKSLEFIEKLKNHPKKIVYNGFFHEVFNEVGRQKVFTDLNDWLKGMVNA